MTTRRVERGACSSESKCIAAVSAGRWCADWVFRRRILDEDMWENVDETEEQAEVAAEPADDDEECKEDLG